jgi:hypothetical protein
VIGRGRFTHLPVPTITGTRGVVIGTGPHHTPGQADLRRQVAVVATVHKHGSHNASATSACFGPIAGCSTYC